MQRFFYIGVSVYRTINGVAPCLHCNGVSDAYVGSLQRVATSFYYKAFNPMQRPNDVNPYEDLVKDFSQGSLSLKVGALIEAYRGYIDSPDFPKREPHEIAQTTKEMMDVIYFCVRAKELMAG